jgi:hypothetical protein
MDICEHMEVVDADGQHVGIVDKVDGDRIRLTTKDALDPQHLFLDKSQVAGVLQKESAVTNRAANPIDLAASIMRSAKSLQVAFRDLRVLAWVPVAILRR